MVTPLHLWTDSITKPHDCRTMGKSGQGGDGLLGANALQGAAWTLADGYHLGLPRLMTNCNWSICMNLSLVKCLLQWHRQLMLCEPSRALPGPGLFVRPSVYTPWPDDLEVVPSGQDLEPTGNLPICPQGAPGAQSSRSPYNSRFHTLKPTDAHFVPYGFMSPML